MAPDPKIHAELVRGEDAPLDEVITRAFEMVGATCQFDVTGHPAMSIPMGYTQDGLPAGMQVPCHGRVERVIDECGLT